MTGLWLSRDDQAVLERIRGEESAERGFEFPDAGTVAEALPAELVLVEDQRAWFEAVCTAADDLSTPLRADARRNLLGVAEQLARWACWERMVSAPGWDTIIAVTGLSRDTVAKWLRWLRERDLLVVVETGSTPATRAMPLADTEGNRRAVYGLTSPAPVEPSQVSGSCPVEQNPTPTVPPVGGTVSGSCSYSHHTRAKRTAQAPRWPVHATATTKEDRLALIQALTGGYPEASNPFTAGGKSDRWWRSRLKVFLDAGWTLADFRWALDHTPDGAPWPHAWQDIRDLRNPTGWILHRLGAWLVDGQPRAPHTRQITVEHTRRQALARAAHDRRHQDRAHRLTYTTRTGLATGAGGRAYLAARAALRTTDPHRPR